MACKLIYLFCMAIYSYYVQISKTYIRHKAGLSMKSTSIDYQVRWHWFIDSFTVNCWRELVWLAAITCLISLHRGPLELYSAYPLKNAWLLKVGPFHDIITVRTRQQEKTILAPTQVRLSRINSLLFPRSSCPYNEVKKIPN